MLPPPHIPPLGASAVFDCDGLLIDTRVCWHSAFHAAAAVAGRLLAAADLDALNGASVRSAAALLSERFGCPADAGVLRAALASAIAASDLQAMPGARTLLDTMHAAGFRLAVATNGPRDAVEDALRRVRLRGYFEGIVSAEDVGADKPDPTVYLEACRLLRADPARTVAFEDSAVGALAARRAGLYVIAVPSSSARLDAHLTVRSLADDSILDRLRLASLLGRNDGGSERTAAPAVED